MGKIIVFVNQKGGVGKTTSAINIGAYIAKAGKKVLLVDFDSQGNMSTGVGVSKDKPTIYELLAEQCSPEEAVKHTPVENLDAISASIDLSGAAIELVDQENREFFLKNALAPLKEKYDYIIIDCMPSLGMMTINALVSSDSVLIPVQAAYLPVKGLQQLIKTILTVKKRLNRKLAIEGILLTMVDFRTNYAKDISTMLHVTYGSKITIFENVIPLSVKAAETSAEGISIYAHCPRSKVSNAYKSLTQEVLENEK